jgi:YbbR domain-containing protein
MDVKKALSKNLGVKLIAAAVAIIIWFNVSSQEKMTRLFNLPTKVVNIPDSLTIKGSVPTEVEASVTATKRQLLYMSFKKVYVTINLWGATPGRFRQTISASNIMLPSGIASGDVQIISPTSIDIYFERRMTRMLPVGLSLSGSIPEGYLLNRPPTIEPHFVEVTGGESDVSHLKKILTRPVDLGKIKESFAKEVKLDFDKKSFQCTPDKVFVDISASPEGKRVLANIPPTILYDEKGLFAEVNPKIVSLTLEGPKAILDTLSSRDVSILLDLSGKKPGKYSLAPDIIIPAGLKNAGLDVESLSVDLKLVKQKRSVK